MPESSAKEEKGGPIIVEDIEDREYQCGYFSCTPKWLQRFNKPPWLLVTVMLVTFSQGFVVSGIKNVNTSTLERRFQLTSSQIGWISASYDIAGAVLGLVLGYLGTFVHKPRVVSICVYFLALGCFVMALPHALAGRYDIGGLETEVCELGANGTDCVSSGSTNNYMGVFIVGQILTAVGGSAIWTLLPPLLKESVKTVDSPLYIGCMLAVSVVGPGMGLVIGGLLLQIYVDAPGVSTDDINLSPNDPRWVGAWWIGFVYSGFAAIIAATLLGLFPKKLPSTLLLQDEKSEAYGGKGEKETQGENFGRSPKDLVISLKIILTNPVFILLTIVGIVEYMLLIGFSVFFPKILQFQFGQTPTMSAVFAGVIIIPTATFSFVIGGLIPKWLNLRIRGLLAQSLIFCVSATFLVFQFLLKCDMPGIAGISVTYDNGSIGQDIDNPDVWHPCNADCGCNTASYNPVCGQNDVTYFTPCHAGCFNNTGEGSDEVYRNCTCIAYESTIDPSLPDAVSGVCETTCEILPLFLVLFLLINICTFIPATSGNAISLRCVPEKQMAFAYGLQSTIIRLLGQVPGPLLFGAIFDRSCWLWQETCEGQGSCWIYNVDDVAKGITYFGLLMKIISSFATLLALILYKPPKEEEEEIQEDSGSPKHGSDPPDYEDVDKGYANAALDTGSEPQLSVQCAAGDIVEVDKTGGVVDDEESTKL